MKYRFESDLHPQWSSAAGTAIGVTFRFSWFIINELRIWEMRYYKNPIPKFIFLPAETLYRIFSFARYLVPNDILLFQEYYILRFINSSYNVFQRYTFSQEFVCTEHIYFIEGLKVIFWRISRFRTPPFFSSGRLVFIRTIWWFLFIWHFFAHWGIQSWS